MNTEKIDNELNTERTSVQMWIKLKWILNKISKSINQIIDNDVVKYRSLVREKVLSIIREAENWPLWKLIKVMQELNAIESVLQT